MGKPEAIMATVNFKEQGYWQVTKSVLVYPKKEMDAFLKEQAVKLFCLRDVGRRCQTIDVGCDCPNCKVMRALREKEKEAKEE